MACGGYDPFPVRDNAKSQIRTLFIGQLPVEVTKEDLVKVFSKFGTITSAKALAGRSSIYPKYGFVTFKEKEQADLAMLVARTEGVHFKGKRLHVQVAVSSQVAKHEKDPPKEEDFSKLGIIPKTIYVAPVPISATENDLMNRFYRYGDIKQVKIYEGKKFGLSEYGFISFETEEDVQRVLDASKVEDIAVRGQDLDVTRASSKPRYTGKLSFDPSLLNLKGLSLMEKDGGNNSQAFDDFEPDYEVSKEVFVPRKLFVGQLPLGIEHEDLVNLFSRFGVVKFAKICRGRLSAYSNFGFVIFSRQDSVERAIEASKRDSIYLNGQKLYVAPAFNKAITSGLEDALRN